MKGKNMARRNKMTSRVLLTQQQQAESEDLMAQSAMYYVERVKHGMYMMQLRAQHGSAALARLLSVPAGE